MPVLHSVQRFRDVLARPIDAASLGVFRIVFGACVAWDAGSRVASGQVWQQYVAPPFHFKYPLCPVPVLPEPWITAVFWVLAAAGVLLLLGLCYRAAALLVWLGLTYDFLLDASLYLNHGYLMCLIALLLCVMPADRAYALRRPGRRRVDAVVPFWTLFLLRAQMLIVYFYAGVAKINGDWLRGAPLDAWLADHGTFPVVGRNFGEPWMIVALAWGGMVFDLAIGWLLLWGRTRAFALVAAGLFHACNHFWFDIGVFPFLAFAASLNFCRPDWPRRAAGGCRRWIGGGGRVSSPSVEVAALAGRAASTDGASTIGRIGNPSYDYGVMVGVAVWLGIQALLPLRHWLYPGDVNWTEEGHSFSWRMLLRDKGYELHSIRVEPPAFAERPRDADGQWEGGSRPQAPWLLQPVADPVPPFFPLPLPLQAALSPEWSRAVEESRLDTMVLDALSEAERRQLFANGGGGVSAELDRALTHRLLYALVQHARRSATRQSTARGSSAEAVRAVFRDAARGLFAEAGVSVPDVELDRLVEGEERLQRLRLTGHQAGRMLVHPELLRQYSVHAAHLLGPLWRGRPRVFVDVRVALNFRPFEPLVSPEIDLGSERFSLGPAGWIEALDVPLPGFEERRRRRAELRSGGYFE
jgi:hypothetical protein